MDLLPPLAVHVGVTCLVAQILLTGFFAVVLPAGPWTKLPAYTAHQLICLPLMCYLGWCGFVAWFMEQDELYEQGMEGRIFGVSPRGADMGAVVFGMMVLWDIPTSFAVPALQDTLMLVHHIGMLFVSGLSMGLFSGGHPVASYYAPFFFGMIECSTIFLTIVDLFHPKSAAWHEWLNDSPTGAANIARSVNEISRPLFALSYLALRCVMFPYVMCSTCLLDFYRAAMVDAVDRRGASSAALLTTCVLCMGFTFLQLNWGVLVAKQVGKAIGLIPDKKQSDAKRD